MDSAKRRVKMISLRLSEEEFEALQDLCKAHGRRSVSDFARNAMQQMLNSPQAAAMELRISELDTRIGQLDREVSRLSALLESTAEPVGAATLPS